MPTLREAVKQAKRHCFGQFTPLHDKSRKYRCTPMFVTIDGKGEQVPFATLVSDIHTGFLTCTENGCTSTDQSCS